MGSRHEQIVSIAKGNKGHVNSDVWIQCLKIFDGLKKDVLFLTLSSKGVPNGQRNLFTLSLLSLIGVLATSQTAREKQCPHHEEDQANLPGLQRLRNGHGHDGTKGMVAINLMRNKIPNSFKSHEGENLP